MDDINDSFYIWETKVIDNTTYNKSEFYFQAQAKSEVPRATTPPHTIKVDSKRENTDEFNMFKETIIKEIF